MANLNNITPENAKNENEEYFFTQDRAVFRGLAKGYAREKLTDGKLTEEHRALLEKILKN